MKKLIFLIIVWMVAIAAQAQTLPGINYQALVRDANGQAITSKPVQMQVSILFGSATGNVVYTETHTATTNAFGQINLSIGEGDAPLGVFDTINWGSGNYYLKTAIDLTGSGTFQELETVRFYSVPYSYHSKTADYASISNLSVKIPAMTSTERDTQIIPVVGMQIFNITTGCLNFYTGERWYETCGEPATFQCGDNFTDSRNGQTYNTVKIGEPCWMTENLNIGILINGNSNQTNNGTIEKYCHNNSETNCTIYGGLYQWDEMMNYSTTGGGQGICPINWHLPTETEWTTLTDYLGGENVAGGKMKEAGTTHWNSPNTGATNSSGFTALPGDHRSFNGVF